jgi:hypothetical protein
MGMDRSPLPNADPSTVWLANLIGATEVVAASAEQCDPAIVKAFSHRLELRVDVRSPIRAGLQGYGRIRKRAFSK